MDHKIYKIKSVEITGDYTLKLVFDDGLEQVIDFSSILYGETFGPLRNLSLFNQVKIDSEVETIVWPNGADFDPVILHDWSKYYDELKIRAREWETATN